MRTPSDSPGDARSQRDDAGDELAGEDANLQAMRQVWLAMRDEQPPAAGVADLLAAARAKAETMKPRPSRWQRLLAGLRRPPALAFAVVLVLIGGAVVFSRRIDRDAALPVPRETTDEPVDPASGPRGVAPPPDRASDEEAAPGTQEAASKTADAQRASGGGTAATAGPAPVANDLPAGASAGPTTPSAPARPMTKHEAGAPQDAGGRGTIAHGASTVRGAGAGETAAEPRARRPATDAIAAEKPDAALARTRSQPPASAQQPGDAVDDADASSAGTAVPEAGAPRSDRDGKGSQASSAAASRLASLYRACEVAAARGDCAAVRRLVVRISDSDRGYRARIATDSAIGKCLAAPAAD